MQKAAEQGLADAQYNLGVFYDGGTGIVQDHKQAVEWYRKAAIQGDPKAQENLGLSYAKGQGVEQNYEEAVIWFTKSAEQGNADAQYNLALCYYNGWGVMSNIEKAKQLLSISAEQGNESAIEALNNFSAENNSTAKKGAGYYIFRILTFPFWLAWQFVKALWSIVKIMFDK